MANNNYCKFMFILIFDWIHVLLHLFSADVQLRQNAYRGIYDNRHSLPTMFRVKSLDQCMFLGNQARFVMGGPDTFQMDLVSLVPLIP